MNKEERKFISLNDFNIHIDVTEIIKEEKNNKKQNKNPQSTEPVLRGQF